MSGNGALASDGAALGEDAAARWGAAPERVVPPSPPLVPAPEVEEALAPPEAGSKALVKSFISNRSFETLLVLARVMVAAPEFPEALRNDTLKVLEGIKTKEQKEIISDALKAYAPYTSRLPRGGSEELASWCQDRSQHHNLYTVLGTTVALAAILSLDQTLVQRIMASGLGEEAPRIIDDLNKRLLSHYLTLFGNPADARSDALAAEGAEQNPLAVTLYLKGFLAPLLEFERPVKRGLLGLLRVFDSADAPKGLSNLCDRPWTARMKSDLAALIAKTPDKVEAARQAREEEQAKLGLKRITSVKEIDRKFIQRVMTAPATPAEKVVFLTSAVALASTVDESAIFELAEQLPTLEGASLRGSHTETKTNAVYDLLRKINVTHWTIDNSGAYGPPMLVLALSKCSGLRNPAFAAVITSQFTSACNQWLSTCKDDYKSDVSKLISTLASEAVNKGVNLPAAASAASRQRDESS